MSFLDFRFLKPSYFSYQDDLASDFYIPALKEAVFYRRAVGFFSSSVLANLTPGIASLALKPNAKIQLIASPHLSDEDFLTINQAYQEKNEDQKSRVLKSLIQTLETPSNELEASRLNLLAHLIKADILDIAIAMPSKERGLFHVKIGYMEDELGNKIVFTGSMNDTGSAINTNYENIDVFTSWGSPADSYRVTEKSIVLEQLWNNKCDGIEVQQFPELKKNIIEKYLKGSPDWTLDDKQLSTTLSNKQRPARNIPRIPRKDLLYQYQKEAIDNWVKHDYRGIYDMATGTGKTITAISSLTRLSNDLSNHLAVFILCPYQHLVNQWSKDLAWFNIEPIIAYGDSPQKDWKDRLDLAIKRQKLPRRKFICVICTNQTFVRKTIQSAIRRLAANKSPLLLIADEVHNLGTRGYLKSLPDVFNYRLGLSATLERHHDDDGTKGLMNFFGEKVIEYSLDRAIKEKKLTDYEYYPIVVSLSPEEKSRYDQLTKQISRCQIGVDSNNVPIFNKKGEMLLLERARLVAGAEEKIPKLKQVLSRYRNDKHLLVYCGATTQYSGELDDQFDDQSNRQIHHVTRMIHNELGMNVTTFTSEDSSSEREQKIEDFTKGETQVLVAIKCLDEGVNVPLIHTAFILASTTNPKEYIQRRGRVLRLADGKSLARIYDFITLPWPIDEIQNLTNEEKQTGLSLVRREVERLREFARLALNKVDSLDLQLTLEDSLDLFSREAGNAF